MTASREAECQGIQGTIAHKRAMLVGRMSDLNSPMQSGKAIVRRKASRWPRIWWATRWSARGW